MKTFGPSYHKSFPQPPPPRYKQIFAAHARISIPIEYVITIYEACHPLEDRYEEYLRHGVDGEMVEKYLDTVLQLNRIIKKN